MFSYILPIDVYPGHLVSSAEVTAFELGEPLKKVFFCLSAVQKLLPTF
jgi:hypothetical protein